MVATFVFLPFRLFLSSVGFKKSFLSLQKNYKNKFALLSCPVSPVPLLRFCFLPHLFSFGSAVPLFCRVYSELRFIGLLFCRIYSASLLWFRFLLLFPVHVSLVLFLKLCLFCFFCLFLLLCFFSRAFPALFSRAQKVLKNVLKIFMVWRSLYRGHILTIFILILSNLIQKIKTQFVFFLDFCCFWFYF